MMALVLPLVAAATVVATGLLWQSVWNFYPLEAHSWTWAWSYMRAYGSVPSFLLWGLYGAGGAILVQVLAIQAVASRVGARTMHGAHDDKTLHGTAHWAKTGDVKAADLWRDTGVVVGGWRRPLIGPRTLRHDGPEHVLCFAPTRSGKGVSLILPTLLSSWRDSVLVLDIKGENYALTAGWRASLGHRVLKFDPTAPAGSARYNPLAEVRVGTGREIADCQNIALMIVDGDGKGLKDYWMKEGWAWLSTALLHVLHRVRRDHGRTATLADVNSFLSGVPDDEDQGDGAGFLMLLNDMIAFEHGAPVIDAEVRRGVNRMKLKAPQERSGVHSSAVTGMALFADPIIAGNTSASDFAVADLMHGDRPAALYLMVPPSDIGRLRPLLRIMITLILSRLTESMAFADGRSVAGYKHRLLLLLDEFTSVGKLEIVEKALAYMAGYGIKAFLIVQGIEQLNGPDAYGHENAIMGNCHVRIAFAPNKIETAKVVSDMCGKATVVQSKRTRNKKPLAITGNVTDSVSGTGRPLLTPDEAMRLRGLRKGWFGRIKPGEVLVFVAGTAPIRGVQRLYFQDRTLLTRARIAPPAGGAVPARDDDDGEKAPELPAGAGIAGRLRAAAGAPVSTP